MSTPRESAPNEELAALHAQVRHYESELTEHQAVIAQRDAMIEHLQEQVRLLLARRFAPSSEKIPDGQLGLFNEAEATAAEEPESAPGTEVGAHRRGTPPGVESRTGAPTLGSGGCSVAFAPGLSPAPIVTFPVPAHRTGQAVFPHPALGRDHAFAHGKLAVRGAR